MSYQPVSELDVQPTHSAEMLGVEWLKWLQEVAQRSERTVGKYADVLLAWLSFCGKHGLDALRPSTQDLEAFMTRKRSNGHKGKPATQQLDVSVLRNWYSWLSQRNKIPQNPALDLMPPKSKTRNPRPVEDEHWQTLWNSNLPPRLRALFGLGYYCGLRRVELHTLETRQITLNWCRDQVCVFRDRGPHHHGRIVDFVRKGGGEDTLPWVDMAEVIAEKLPHLLPDASVFVSSVHYVKSRYERVSPWRGIGHIYKRMSEVCETVGIPHYSPHQLRHSAATNLCNAGVPIHIVKELMNHNSIDTTMLYVRAGANELRHWRTRSRD